MASNFPATSTRKTGMWFLAVLALSVACGFFAGHWIANSRRTRDLSLAREFVELSESESAVKAYRRYLDRFPNDSAARLELAQLLQRRDPKLALHELRLIDSGTAQFATAARLVAAISLTLQRDYDALGPLIFLESQNPDDAGVQQALAEIYFRRRDFERSLEYSLRCLTLKPDCVEAWLLVAEAKDSLGLTSEMIGPLEAALALDPELPQAHLNLAYALEATGHPDGALPHAQWFVSRFPTSVPAHRILASIERSQGRYQEALESAQAALKLAPKNFECALIAADVLLYLRRPTEAYELLNSLIADRPRERRLLTPLLRAAVQSGQKERVKEIHARLQELETSQ